MQEVVSEAYRLFAEYLYRALAGSTPQERFQMAGDSYLDFALEQPALYEVLYVPLEMLGIQPSQGDEAGQAACAIGQFWADRVREMMDAGLMQKGDPHAVSLTLWAHGHGLISIRHRGLLPVSSDEEFRGLVVKSFERLVIGLGTQEYLDFLRENPSRRALLEPAQAVGGGF